MQYIQYMTTSKDLKAFLKLILTSISKDLIQIIVKYSHVPQEIYLFTKGYGYHAKEMSVETTLVMSSVEAVDSVINDMVESNVDHWGDEEGIGDMHFDFSDNVTEYHPSLKRKIKELNEDLKNSKKRKIANVEKDRKEVEETKKNINYWKEKFKQKKASKVKLSKAPKVAKLRKKEEKFVKRYQYLLKESNSMQIQELWKKFETALPIDGVDLHSWSMHYFVFDESSMKFVKIGEHDYERCFDG